MNTELLWDTEYAVGFLIVDEDGEFDENESSTTIRGQYIMDGAESLEEAAQLCREYAEILDSMREQGYELISMIDGDRGIARVA